MPIEGTPIANVYRVANAQTTSAYVVRRRYVPTLIEAFFKSAELFRVYGAVPTLTNYAMQTYLFAIDMIWKKHQISDRWACLPQVCISAPPILTSRSVSPTMASSGQDRTNRYDSDRRCSMYFLEHH